MARIRLRPVREADLTALEENQSRDADPWNWFNHTPAEALRRRFATDGMLSEEAGTLAVETLDGMLAGSVSWFTAQHGPSLACQALNIGISLFPAHRERGYGSQAQRALARYLFATTLVERIEAETDVENIAEQRALERAGFTREGVLRHTQFRAGRWRDNVIYSVLRAEINLDQFLGTGSAVMAAHAEMTVPASPDSSCCGIWPNAYWAGADPGTSVNVQMTSNRSPGQG